LSRQDLPFLPKPFRLVVLEELVSRILLTDHEKKAPVANN
jgi:hypothetical protein